MNKIHKRRIYIISFFIIILATATGLILFALKKNINVFLTPKQINAAHLTIDQHFRLGGVVKLGSVHRSNDNLNVDFIVTDYTNDISVHYDGVLPDLFREGTGVIAEGHLDSQGQFRASQVLAKHDENYMPKNVYKALREQTK